MSQTSAPDEAAVAAWLREHPDFLARRPELALAIEVPREQGQATSLASYQLDVLREKNRELNRRLQELFAVANENERLTVRLHQLMLALLRARDLPATLGTLVASLREDFGSEWVRVMLFKPAPALEPAAWWKHLPRQAAEIAPFAEFINAGEPLCGRLQPAKLSVLYGEDAVSVQSVALLSLGGHGLLAIGSGDSNRFYPGMGTLFLRLLGETVSAALARFD